MQSCINHNYILDVSEITNEEIFNKGLIMISRRLWTPIVTGKEKTANLLKVMYNYEDIYFVDKLPEKYVEILAYPDLDTSKYDRLKPLLIIKK